MNIWHWKCVQSEAERSVFEAAVRRSVQFGEAEQLDGIEGELPAADVLQHVFHPAAVPAHTQTGNASLVCDHGDRLSHEWTEKKR